MSSTNAIVATSPSEASLSLTRDRIAVFVGDDLTAAALRTGLEGANLEFKRGNIRNATKLLQEDVELHAVIADISGIDNPFEALEALSGVCPADVEVALVGDNTDIPFYRKLIEAGVCEYLPKPITRDTVQSQLRPKLLGDVAIDEANRSGHVVSVCGAQGGAGATSIAINLALQIAETTKARVVLFDLHLQGGEVPVMMGVSPGPGLRKALEDPERADTLFLERATIEINKRVHVLAADEALDAQLQITEAGIRHVMALLRRRFSYIVVDVPVPLVPAIHPVIAMSRHVLVLLEAEVTGLRNAHSLRTVVTDIAGKNRVFTVLNRAGRRGGLPMSSIVKGLDGNPDMIIPDLGHRMTEAVNTGIPALNTIRALRGHLAPIVREIAGIGDQKRSLIQRIFGR